MKEENQYTIMQKRSYENGIYQDSVRTTMRGERAEGDHFTPLNEMEELHRHLFRGTPKGGLALDFGCGPGRAIIRYRDRFDRIDGVDISQANIDLAREYADWAGLVPSLYVNNGIDLRRILSDTYDVVFSIQTLIHISVYDVRRRLFEEMHRVLKPGGWLCMQMGFGEGTVFKHSVVQYYDNMWNAKSTNGRHSVTVSSPVQVQTDLEEIGFTDFSYDLIDMDWNHPQWICFRGKK